MKPTDKLYLKVIMTKGPVTAQINKYPLTYLYFYFTE